MKMEFVLQNEVKSTHHQIIPFLERRFNSEIYRNGNEFWTVGESPRLVALLNGQELILPAVNGTGVVKIPAHKIPEYKKKFFNLYFCQTCMEKRGEGLYRTFFLRDACPSGHSWKLLASTFTWVEVRQQKPPKEEAIDPEVQSALNDIKETRLFCELYRGFLRRQAKEEARRSALKKESQIVQVSKVSKQGTGQSQREQTREEVPNFNFGITYIDKEGIKHHLSPEQILELLRRLGENVPAAPLQTVDQVVKEFRSQNEEFIPASIEDEEEILFPLARGRQSKQRQKQREKFDTKRYKVTWKGAASIRMQQIPAPLGQQQVQHEKLTAEEFKQKYQLDEVTSLQKGGYKGIKWISFSRSLIGLTFYSFPFRPSGRGVGEFSTEQVALATHLANKMGGHVITSEDKKRNIVSLCVLLEDATIVVARRRGQ